MKHQLFLFAIILPLSVLLLGCEVTGDPHRGGIFWSETKARKRQDDRRAHLDNIESDTARVERRNSQIEGAAARRRAMLEQ